MIKENYEKIMEIIEESCHKSQRSVDDVLLLAVSKTHSAEKINECLSVGVKAYGENKIQEAELKNPLIHREGKQFHFIGHLQSNKINKLLALSPDLIHSIDSVSTAEKLNQALIRLDRFQDILIEVNTSGEESKNGIAPEALETFILALASLSQIRIKGLMTIGTLTDDRIEIRRCFRHLRELFEGIKAKQIDHCDMQYLSMGMSGDFDIAIEEGSHIIRVGSLLFGNRDYTQS